MDDEVAQAFWCMAVVDHLLQAPEVMGFALLVIDGDKFSLAFAIRAYLCIPEDFLPAFRTFGCTIFHDDDVLLSILLSVEFPGDTILGVLNLKTSGTEGIAYLVAGSPVLGGLGLGA